MSATNIYIQIFVFASLLCFIPPLVSGQPVTLPLTAKLVKTFTAEKSSTLYAGYEVFPYSIEYVTSKHIYVTGWFDTTNNIYTRPLYNTGSMPYSATYGETQPLLSGQRALRFVSSARETYKLSVVSVVTGSSSTQAKIYPLTLNAAFIPSVDSSPESQVDVYLPTAVGLGRSGIGAGPTNFLFYKVDSSNNNSESGFTIKAFTQTDPNSTDHQITPPTLGHWGSSLQTGSSWLTRAFSLGTLTGRPYFPYTVVWDNLRKMFIGFQNSTTNIVQWAISDPCPSFSPSTYPLSVQLLLGGAYDGLFWIFDYTNGLYKGYDLRCCTSNNNDTTSPTVTVEPASVVCNDDLSPHVVGLPELSDDCMLEGGLDVTYADTITYNVTPAGCVGGHSSTLKQVRNRTWTAKDSCGNVGRGVQVISIYG